MHHCSYCGPNAKCTMEPGTKKQMKKLLKAGFKTARRLGLPLKWEACAHGHGIRAAGTETLKYTVTGSRHNPKPKEC